MRVLVTGAGGYIGSAVVRALSAAGHEPVAMVRRDTDQVPAGVEVRAADLFDGKSLLLAVAGVDAVCHLAGLTRARESQERPFDYYAVNVGGTVELLRTMCTLAVPRFVFASTSSIYASFEQQRMSEDTPDEPSHPYAWSKAAAEAMIEWECRRTDLSGAVLRLFNAAGRADPDATRIIPRVLAAAAQETGPLGVNGDGSVIRDYLHVDDAAQAFVAALNHLPPPGHARIYNIGSGAGASVSEVIQAAERVTGRPVPVTHNPPAPEPAILVCDPSRAAQELGWQPHRSDLDTILRDAWTARGSR